MTDDPTKDNGFFRGMIGLIALVGAMAGFFILFFFEIPARNENALLLALGIVMGWAGSVVASEYGSTTTGRKVADSAIRGLERQNIAAESPPTPDGPLNEPKRPTGKPGDPVHITEEPK